MIAPKYERPGADEFAPYYEKYIARVPDGDLLALYATQLDQVHRVIGSVPESRGSHAYAPGKWSIKQVTGHLADCERVFAYRALRIARSDPTPLPGFDENAWMPSAGFDERSLSDVLGEWIAVRQASIALFGGLPSEATARRGVANDQAISVRALAYIGHGHVTHHLGVLQERYL